MNSNSQSGSFKELKQIIDIYQSFLPRYTFPVVFLSIAACAVFFAWFGGNYLFHSSSLSQRIVYSWFIALIEYIFLIIGIGGSVEVLSMSQNTISILIHALQLIAYFILNLFTTKYELTWKHYLSIMFIFSALILLLI
jgi:uncharacterized protein (DUF486 family)